MLSGCHEQQHVSWSRYCSQVNSVKSLGRRTVVGVESESVAEEAERNLNKFSQFLDLGPNSSWDWHWLCIRPQKCGNAFLMDPCSSQAGLCFIISWHTTTQFCSNVSLVLSSTKTNNNNKFECCFFFLHYIKHNYARLHLVMFVMKSKCLKTHRYGTLTIPQYLI